jgi:AP2 domain
MVKLECKYPGEGATSRGLTHTEHGDPVQVSQAYKSPAVLIAATIEIPLTRGYVTRIDAADRAFTDGRKWHATAQSSTQKIVYACAKINGRCTMLHTLLCPAWEFVDHADGNGLNNCRSNLRDGTGFRNTANSRLASNNTSGYKGVTWKKRAGKWCASIMINQKAIHLGTFSTPEEAAAAYDRAAVSLFGEYAKTNAMLGQATSEEAEVWRYPLAPPEERTHCSAGHELTPENTYTRPDGEWNCRQCGKLRMREYRREHPVANPRPTGRICPPGCTCGRHWRAK